MTPDLPEHPTDLTPEQRAYLNQLRDFAGRPPDAGRLFARLAPKVLVLSVVLLGAAGAAAWYAHTEAATWFCLGVLTGFLMVFVGNIKRAVRLWPATAAVLDFRRIDDLLGEPGPDPDARP